MSALFASASSQYLKNAGAPVTAAPYTAAFWMAMPTSGSVQVLWSNTDTAGANDGWEIFKETSNVLKFNCYAGASYVEVATANAIISNGPSFVVYRVISAANRRGSVLHANGVIDHVQETTSLTPSSIDTVALGCTVQSSPNGFMDGKAGEFALWNIDIQGDGAQLQDSTLRQMAYGGPFSLRHALGNLVNYESFRANLESSKAKANESYTGAGKARQVWTNTGGAKLGPHFQLPAGYVRQFQGSRLAAVL